MNFLDSGIEKLKKGSFKEAFSLFEEGYFANNDTECGCYLSQMCFDERITPRTQKSLMQSILLWEITSHKTSSKHKLGVAYYNFGKTQSAKQKGLELLKTARKEGYEPSYCVLGVLAYKAERYDEAVENFVHYGNLKNDASAYYCYGCSLINKDNPDFNQGKQVLDYCIKNHRSAKAAELLASLHAMDAPFDNERLFYIYTHIAADLGSKKACENIGLAILWEDYVPENAGWELALNYLLKAGSALSATGHCAISEIYFSNHVGSDYLEKSEYHALQSLKLDNKYDIAHFAYGQILFLKEEYENAAFHLEQSFNLGYTASCELLFTLHYLVLGNEDKAFKYSKFIIENNIDAPNPDVYSFMALTIFNERYGTKQDYSLMYKYYTRAAELGCVDSMEMIGLLRVEVGEEVVDDETAVYWLEKADSLGGSDALYYLGLIYIQKLQATKACDCLSKAYYLRKNADAARKMAELYEAGFITGIREKRKAREWMHLAETIS